MATPDLPPVLWVVEMADHGAGLLVAIVAAETEDVARATALDLATERLWPAAFVASSDRCEQRPGGHFGAPAWISPE